MITMKEFVLITFFSLSNSVTNFMPNLSVLDVNVASWSSIGGWKPNSLIFIRNKACSSAKYFLGISWNLVMVALKAPKTSCPILPGVYKTTGIDMKEFQNHNFPKVYFYGKYKLSIKIKDINKKVLSCGVLEFSLVRPWEKLI
ncbi:uncharacterized protein LOC112599457 [Melanaphis sacchari]|uniref:uncharacterized protein LOC112599457 n=1 Tax=Melanaphis sacchari TaxID=742174 RepID=UPI000DC12FC7|nr:uncharacterized protein LOC112599457 [Melanaphis sacchari]